MNGKIGPNRWKGEFPKIGIRPTIDGRRKGIRESLEQSTADLARSVANLISENLCYPNGEKVKCVLSDTNIGGVAEAAACEEKFSHEGVGASITVTPCWCYSSETMDMNPLIPKAIWGFNGSERPGAVYLAAVLATHNQKGLPAFSIYGHDVQDAGDNLIPDDVVDKILRFSRASLAVSMMRGKSYLSMGGVSMGIAGSIVDQSFFEHYLGMRVEAIDLSELLRRIEFKIYDQEEYRQATRWVNANCREGRNYNPVHMQRSRQEMDLDWEKVVMMAIIARDLMVGNPRLSDLGFEEEANGHNAMLAGFQGQRHWTDFQPTGDFLEAILNSSFDWSGPRQPYIIATENDSLNGVVMLFGHLLTNAAQVFADVRTYWSPQAVERTTGYKLVDLAANGFIHLINSGAAALDATGWQEENGKPVIKPWWKITPEEQNKCLQATTWYPSMTGYFRGGGFSSQYLTRSGMPVTISRINLIYGLGPVLQIAEGWTINLPKEVHGIINERTDPTWPTHYFVPNLTGEGAFRDVYSVMANWGANHCAMSYGHIGADMISLASMLRIPVCMHNVPIEKIFRPSAWGAFGTFGIEAADFHACKTFGPLY